MLNFYSYIDVSYRTAHEFELTSRLSLTATPSLQPEADVGAHAEL